MNTLVNLLKYNSVFNKNKWTLVAISIVFFIGLYWYYKKSKENFKIEVGIPMDQLIFKSDDGNINLDNVLSKNLIQSKILYNKININSLNENNEVVDTTVWENDIAFIESEYYAKVADADKARTNQEATELFSISDIESVEFNLYTSGACELSADYKKQYEAIINAKQYGKFDVTNTLLNEENYKSKNYLHFINFNVIKCELLNLKTNKVGYDDGNGDIITDDVKRKCTRAGVGWFEKDTLGPNPDNLDETKNKLPLLEFKIKGKYYDKSTGIVKDFTVTYYFNEYETQLDLTSGSTTDLNANMLAWMERIEFIIGAKDIIEEDYEDVLKTFIRLKFPP